MKRLLLSVLLFTSALTASARVGETYEEVVKRYGEPLDLTSKTILFSKDGIFIGVAFLDGVSMSETFFNESKTLLSADQVKTLMEANNRGQKWTLAKQDKTLMYFELSNHTAIAALYLEDPQFGSKLCIMDATYVSILNRELKPAPSGF